MHDSTDQFVDSGINQVSLTRNMQPLDCVHLAVGYHRYHGGAHGLGHGKGEGEREREGERVLQFA